MLVGREKERARIEATLESARASRASALLLRGEAGAGKTALVDYAVSRAQGMHVLRAVGVESETELEFSALHELCRPLLDGLEAIPEAGRLALQSALGLRAERSGGDRFLVGTALLALLAGAAEERPVLVVCDDAHWFDGASLDAVSFAVRRLDADAVAVVLAARPGAPKGLPRVDELRVDGLAVEDAALLLGDEGDVSVDGVVAARLTAETAGNPLALVELRGLLTRAQLTGAEVLTDGVVPGTRAEAMFATTLDQLDAECEDALLVAALAPRRDFTIVAHAIRTRGLDPAIVEQAEAEGLISLDEGRLEFRHPLARSAIVHRATPAQRRAAHAAIADSLTAEADLESRAWHRAGATVVPDEAVASELDAAARLAAGRAGYAGASAAWERAAELSPDDRMRQQRLLLAADAAWRSGAPERSAPLLVEPLTRLGDGLERAQALRLHGALAYFDGDGDAAATAFLDAAGLLANVDPEAAVASAGDAVSAQFPHADAARMLACADRVARLSVGHDPDTRARGELARGYALCFGGRLAEGRGLLSQALRVLDPARGHDLLAAGRLSWVHAFLGRDDAARSVLDAAIERARLGGAIGPLSYLLGVSAFHDLRVGRWRDARASLSESLELSHEVRQPVVEAPVRGGLVVLAALRGDETAFREHVGILDAIAQEHGFTLYRLLVPYATGLFLLGEGRIEEAAAPFEEAIARLGQAGGVHLPGFTPVFDLVEILARSGRGDEARATLEVAIEPDVVAMPREAGLAARARGLLADGDRFDEPFREAIEHHTAISTPFEQARTQLCFGERLRRVGRRIEARDQLRSALATFDDLGAAGWAERARAELRATGETLRREAVAGDELTPQELQIALQVVDGKTNREVAAALFLSPKTVEFHLGRIYRKLSVGSRRDLARVFAGAAAG